MWRVPRTWTPGELVTALMLNQHVRDQLSSLQAEHFLTKSFRGLHLRTHEDADKASGYVQLVHADEVVMSDGTRLGPWDNLSAYIGAAGAGGLDAGSPNVSTWYETHAIAKDDGTKALILHRAKDYYNDVTIAENTTPLQLRVGATDRVKLAQGFQVVTAGPVAFVDLTLIRVGSPDGSVWATIESDAAGNPSGTVLATSVVMFINNLSTTKQTIRFIFRAPASLAAATQYHLVLNGNYILSGVNGIQWEGNSASVYASGVAKQYDGTSWAASVSPVDLSLKVYVTRNDTALTLPPAYTKSAKVGYVYRGSGGVFVVFAQQNRRVAVARQTVATALTNLNPTLTDLAAIVPPVPVSVYGVANGSVAGTLVVLQRVMDGYDSSVGNRDIQLHAAGALWNMTWAFVSTELQALYAWVDSNNANIYINGWEW